MSIDDINALIVSFIVACAIIAGPILLAVTLSKPEPDLSYNSLYPLLIWAILSLVVTTVSVFCLIRFLKRKESK